MRRGLRWAAGLGLAALYILHNDLWWWSDGRLVLGMPIGLTYHVLFCLAVAALIAVLVYGEQERDES